MAFVGRRYFEVNDYEFFGSVNSSAHAFELTRLHRLWALPSVAGYPTIASLADATAPNLRALIRHPPDQLDHSRSQGFTLGQKQPHTQHRLGRLFRAEAHIPPLTKLHQLMT